MTARSLAGAPKDRSKADPDEDQELSWTRITLRANRKHMKELIRWT